METKETKIEVTSKRYSLNRKDFLRGLLMAVVAGAAFTAELALESGEFHLRKVLYAGLAAGLAYLLKNYLQPAQVKKTITNQEVDALKSENTAAK